MDWSIGIAYSPGVGGACGTWGVVKGDEVDLEFVNKTFNIVTEVTFIVKCYCDSLQYYSFGRLKKYVGVARCLTNSLQGWLSSSTSKGTVINMKLPRDE